MPEGLPIHIDDVPSRRWEYGEVGATRRRLGVAAKAKRLGIALIERNHSEWLLHSERLLLEIVHAVLLFRGKIYFLEFK